jgi:hypothetical protein
LVTRGHETSFPRTSQARGLPLGGSKRRLVVLKPILPLQFPGQRSLRYLPSARCEGSLPHLALWLFSTQRSTTAPSSSHLIRCCRVRALVRMSNNFAWSRVISTLGTGPIYTEGMQLSSQTTTAFRNVVLAQKDPLWSLPVI